jgi:hypothetical protein
MENANLKDSKDNSSNNFIFIFYVGSYMKQPLQLKTHI